MSDKEEPPDAAADEDDLDTDDGTVVEPGGPTEGSGDTDAGTEAPTEDGPGAEATPASDDDAPADPARPAEVTAAAAPLTREDLGPVSRGLPVGPLVLGALALVLVGFIVGRVTSDGDGTDEAPPPETAAELTFPSGDQDRSGYWGFGGVTPAVADSFSSGDSEDGLGETDTGERWTVVSGRWRIDADLALAEAGGPQPSLVVVPGGSPNRLTEATLTVVEEGAGVVFRFRDADNYWAMTASPSVGIWNVIRVLDGQAAVAAEVAGPTADGTTVTVANRGAELQILIDGIEALRLTDEALQAQDRSGLIAPPEGDGSARFDRFYVGNMPT